LWCFIVRIIDFIREFWKILEYLLKNTDTLNKKHFQNSIIYYLLIYFLVSLTSFFFSILPVYGFTKKIKSFVLFYCMNPRFYQKILQNYGFFVKKNWDIWYPKFQQNSIVYYFVFIFLVFLAFCLLFHLSKLVQKLWNLL